MSFMFKDCTSLQNIDISKFKTPYVETMNSMFYNCTSIKNINIGYINMSNVTDMSYMFYNCKTLPSIILYGFDTRNVQYMNGMFSHCNALKSIDLSELETDNLSGMNEMFAYCNSITTLDFSGFNTQYVSNMNNLFDNCTNLKTIYGLETLDTSNVSSTYYMFNNCSSLNYIDLSAFNIENISYTNNMFANCTELKTIDTNDFKLGNKSNADNMFENCTKLTKNMTVNNTNIASYKNIFKGCSTDTAAKVIVNYTSPETKEIARNLVNTKNIATDHVYLLEEETTLLPGPTLNQKLKSIANYTKIQFVKDAPIKGTDVSKNQDKSIMAYVENGTLKIASLGTIYANTDASNMFMNLNNITDILFTNFNFSRATNMNNMFKTCSNLKEIDFTKLDTSNVTTMNDTFCGCSAITEFNLKALNTSKVTSMHGTFYDCDGITSLNVNDLDTSKVTDIGFLVAECNNLQTINIDKINVSNVTSTRHMFKYCENLTNIVLPQFNFAKIKDSSQMFNYCYKLSGNITVNGNTTTDYSEMFYNCSTDTNAKFIVKYTDNTTKNMAINFVNTKTNTDHVYLYEPISVKYKFKASDSSNLPTDVTNLLPTDNLKYDIYENNTVTIKNPTKTTLTIGNNKYTFQSYDKTNGFTITENMLKSDSSGNKYIEIVGTWKKEETIPIIEGNTLIPGPQFNRKLEVGQDLDPYTHIIFKRVSSMSGISGIDVSAAQNKSIIAYKEGTKYYVVSTKTILANKDASYMFNTTTTDSLTTIDLTNFDIGQAQNVEEMFSGQSDLRNIINIENMHTYHVTNMNSMFYGCYSLGSMDLSKWNTSKVTNLFGTFVGCGCPTLNVSTWNVSNVTTMRCTFMNMENLRTLDLSGWDTKNSKNFRAFFDRCYNLGEVKGNIVIGTPEEAFWIAKNCSNIRLKVTVTETYNDSKFSNAYSAMFDNSSQNGRITVDYTSNARSLAQEIVNESKSRCGSPNVYLGSQVSIPRINTFNMFNLFKINKNNHDIDYKIREKLRNNNKLLNNYESNKLTDSEINNILN